MANTYDMKIPLSDLRKTEGDKDLLYGLVIRELVILGRRLRLDVPMVWHLVDKVVEKVQEEMKKFSTDLDKPYPPVGKSQMVLFVTFPELGKLAAGVEWREPVNV